MSAGISRMRTLSLNRMLSIAPTKPGSAVDAGALPSPAFKRGLRPEESSIPRGIR